MLCKPPKGKKRSSGSHGLKEPKVEPSKRVKDFPNEYFLGRLSCKACRETLSVKRSTLINHIGSTKHEESKAKFYKRQAREVDIESAMKRYDESSSSIIG